jgi:hypothetical protein
MPRLNSLGDALMGIGGVTGNISVNGVVPASMTTVTAGGWRWITSGIIGGQADTGSGFGLYKVTLPNTLAQLESPLQPATTFEAGNGIWAAFRIPPNGVRTSITGFGPFPNARLADIDFSGNIGIVQNYLAGRGLATYDTTGTPLATWDVAISFPVIRMRDTIIAYAITGGVWQLRNVTTGALLPIANQATTVTAMVPVVVGGDTWVLEQTDTAITFRPATSGLGYVIAAAPAFNSDVIALSATTARIAWSTTAGEGPTRLRMADLTLGTGTQTLWSTESGSLVSSTGPTLSLLPMAVGAVQGGTAGRELQSLLNHPIADTRSGRVTVPWHKWFNRLSYLNSQPIDLGSGVTGVLPPEHGGTGVGTSVINATNITIGTLPQNVKWRQYDIDDTGTVNNLYYNSADFLRCANASTLTITGLLEGVGGQRLVIVATNADVTIANESASSTAANRVTTFSEANVTITAKSAAFLEYDETDERWRLLFVSAADVDVSTAGFWAPLCAGTAYYTPDLVAAAGTWANVTNGDPVSPEITFDSNGDVVMSFTPGTGPYLAPIVTSEDSTIAVWTPTP